MPKLPEDDLRILTDLAASMHIGERCSFCGRIFETIEDVRGAIWYGYPNHAPLVHKVCWEDAVAQGPPE